MNVAENLYETGSCYQYGKGGLSVNLEMAKKCYTDAAQLGHSKAQYELARLLIFSFGYKLDEYLPVDLFHKSARQGNIDAIQFIRKNYHEYPYYKVQEPEPQDKEQPIEPARKKQRTKEFVSGLDFYF